MSEKRLYYNDSYISTFKGNITDLYPDKDNLYLIFDRTGFYPSSGGQPCDYGTVEGIPVIDVFEREDGEIVHVIPSSEGHIFKTGMNVNCIIDWQRRFDHMQQHTGQHILSQCFFKLYNLETAGFHLGKDISTIDLNIPNLSEEEIFAGEVYANKMVFENRSVYIKYMDKEDPDTVLRKESKRTGLLRIINIHDFDSSACGGTHCNATGEAGLIVIKDWEKLKEKFRIEFLCGYRALKLFREYSSVFRDISCRFSVGYHDVLTKIDKLITENKENYKALKKLTEKCMKQEIELLNSEKIIKDNIVYIKHIYKDKTLEELKGLAKNVIMKSNNMIVCLATSPEPCSLIIARSKDLQLNLSELMKNFNGKLTGKGGGTPDFVQGGGYKLEEIENILLEL
ncbi:MAG: DHHA1 domain-containing protein [Candidatus Eremiobacterota bacterium]